MSPVWSVRVRTASDGTAVLHSGPHRLAVGPAAAPEEAEAPAALALLLAALAGDLLHGFRREATRARIDVFALEARAEAALHDPLAALGVVGADGDPSLERISLELFVSSDAPRDALTLPWEAAKRRSPLAATLAKSTDLSLTLRSV